MWMDLKTKIRRFLRDPEANIWDDSFLLHLWNDEQREFSRRGTPDEIATVLRHPAIYQLAYLYPWEYYKAEPTQGYVFRALLYHWQYQGVCLYDWELQQIGITSGSETGQGYQFTQPWEGYMISTPARLIPMWFPSDCRNILYMAYDRDPLEYIAWKKLQGNDRTFKIYAGKPCNYTIADDLSREFFLYPRPAADWDDLTSEDILIDTSWTTSDAETGTGIDLANGETNQNLGIGLDALRADNNVVLIYRQQVNDIENLTDEPEIVKYFQKYLACGVLEKAYMANTDGKISSLADYWGWRKELGYKVVERFKWSRLKDRDFRLTSTRGGDRKRQGPRLPATYPPI
jgi:hypothetical protein